MCARVRRLTHAGSTCVALQAKTKQPNSPMISEKSSTIKQPYARSAPSSPPPLLPLPKPGGEGVTSDFWGVLYQRILASISGPVFMHAAPISGLPPPLLPLPKPGGEGVTSDFGWFYISEYSGSSAVLSSCMSIPVRS